MHVEYRQWTHRIGLIFNGLTALHPLFSKGKTMAAVSVAPMTKNLTDILADSPNLRAWGIRRRDGYPEQIVRPLVKFGRV
ncbi:MAG: hypothetical protein ACOVLE_03515, partial [Pirellula staleyi]